MLREKEKPMVLPYHGYKLSLTTRHRASRLLRILRLRRDYLCKGLEPTKNFPMHLEFLGSLCQFTLTRQGKIVLEMREGLMNQGDNVSAYYLPLTYSVIPAVDILL